MATVEDVTATTTNLVDGYRGITFIASSQFSATSGDDSNINHVYIDNLIFNKREAVYGGSDQEAVDLAYDGISPLFVKGLNPGTDAGVMTDLSLPASYASGAQLSYSTDRPDVVDAATGQLLVAPSGTQVPFDLTVTITKGAATRQKTLEMYVRSDGGPRSALVSSPTNMYMDDCSIQEWPMGYSQDSNMFVGSSQFISKQNVYIPEGQFLMYSRPGYRGRTRIWQYYPITDGMWKLEFDARFLSLPIPSDPASNSNSGYTGFAAQVRTTSTKNYRVSFNNLNEQDGTVDIYIEKEMGTNPYSQNAVYYEFKGVHLPDLHDYHKWSLIYEGNTLLVQLDDDEIVASATGITAIGDGVDIHNALYFLGETDVSSPDKNIEVYLDNVRFSKPYGIGAVEVSNGSDKRDFTVNAEILSDPEKYETDYDLELDVTLYDRASHTEIATETAAAGEGFTGVNFENLPESGAFDALLVLRSGASEVDRKETTVYVPEATDKVSPGAVLTAGSGRIYSYDGFSGLSGWDTLTYTSSAGNGDIHNCGDGSQPFEIPVTLNGWFGVYLTTSSMNQEIVLSAGGEDHILRTNLSGGQGGSGTVTLADTFVFAKNFQNEKVTIKIPEDRVTSFAGVKFVSFSQQQIDTYNLPNLLEDGVPAKNIMIDEDGFSMFYGGLLPNAPALDNFVDEIADIGNWGSLSWATGTSSGFNYDSAYMGEAYSAAYDYEGTMRPGDHVMLESVRNIIDSTGKATGQVLAEHGDARGDFDVWYTLRMSFFYDPSSLYPCLNSRKYFDLYDEGYRTSDNIGLSYMYPEVRDLYLDVLEEMANFNGIDGIILDWSRYSKIVMNEYTGDQVEFRTQFMRDLRSRLPNTKIGVKFIQDQWDVWANSPNVTYYTDNIDLQTWIDEGLVDIIMPIDMNEEHYFDVGRYRDMIDNSTNPNKDQILIYPGIFSIDYMGKYLQPIDYIVRVHDMYEQGADGALLPILQFSEDPSQTPDEYRILGDKNRLEKWYKLGYVPSYNKVQATLTGSVPENPVPAAPAGPPAVRTQVTVDGSTTRTTVDAASLRAALAAGPVTIRLGAGTDTDELLLPADVLQERSQFQLSLEFDTLTLTLDETAVPAGATSLSLLVERMESADHRPAARIQLLADGQEVPSGGRIAAEFRYTPAQGERPEALFVSRAGIPVVASFAGEAGIWFALRGEGVYQVEYAEHDFSDVADSSAADAIGFLFARNVVNGVAQTGFAPLDDIRRADLVRMAIRAFQLSAPAGSGFDDVDSGRYYSGDVLTAQTLGLIFGSNGSFYPEAAVTREDAAVIIDRALLAISVNGYGTEAGGTFGDEDTFSDYAADAIRRLAAAGIVEYGGDYNPKAPLSREEFARLLVLALKFVYGQPE